MQQTEKYKLNLIEPTDPFLPEGLNQNTQKIEDAMIAHEEKVDGQVAEVATRVTELEGRKIAYGYVEWYSSSVQTVPLPFTPSALMAQQNNNSCAIVVPEKGGDFKIVDGGFTFRPQFSGGECKYIAFG